MSRGRSPVEQSARVTSVRLASVGRLATRAGVVAIVTAAPLSLATSLAILANASTLTAGIDAVVEASSGPLAAGTGVEWLLHVGVFGLLVGCWLLGAGLVLSELAD